jgi:hypothetical protein
MGDATVRGESAVEYFKELVDGALEHQKLVVNDLTAFYVVHLLAGFAEQRLDDGAALALRLGDAIEGGDSYRKRRALKEIGDTSLFVSGFFPDSFNRGSVDVEYYMQVGGTAYAALSRHSSELAPVFAELATKFPGLVDILSEVSERTACSSARDLLRMYERWLKTGSRHSAQVLIERGVVPVRAASSRVQ